jgi:hypothetical protein
MRVGCRLVAKEAEIKPAVRKVSRQHVQLSRAEGGRKQSATIYQPSTATLLATSRWLATPGTLARNSEDKMQARCTLALIQIRSLALLP